MTDERYTDHPTQMVDIEPPCGHCAGTGRLAGSKQQCGYCAGLGWVKVQRPARLPTQATIDENLNNAYANGDIELPLEAGEVEGIARDLMAYSEDCEEIDDPLDITPMIITWQERKRAELVDTSAQKAAEGFNDFEQVERQFVNTPEAWEARKVIPGETREEARERLEQYRVDKVPPGRMTSSSEAFGAAYGADMASSDGSHLNADAGGMMLGNPYHFVDGKVYVTEEAYKFVLGERQKITLERDSYARAYRSANIMAALSGLALFVTISKIVFGW